MIDRDLLDAALDATANGIMIADVDGVIQWVNPAFTEMSGYPLEELAARVS